jgi:hypothetical protein
VLQPAEPVKTALPAAAEAPELELGLVDGLAAVEVDPEGATPTGGGPLLGCLDSHDWKAEGVTTRT